MHCEKHGFSGAELPTENCKACRQAYYVANRNEKTDEHIAHELRVHIRTIYFWGNELNLPKKNKELRATLVDNPEEAVKTDLEEHKLKRSQKEVKGKYEVLLREHERLQTEHEAFLALHHASPEVHEIAPHKGSVSESTVVVLLSDWHVEENVTLDTTSQLNEYTMAIAKKRADDCFKVIVRLVNIERANTPINTMVLWLGGDFISGNIHEELLETCEVPPIDAAIFALGLLRSGIDHLLAHTDLSFVIPCSVGNHSRITPKSRNATESGNSLELFLYKTLASLYEKEKRVTFIIERGYHTYIKVYDLTLRFHHGHQVKYQGGVGGLTIPLNKAIAQWNKGRVAHIDCQGHYHTFFDQGNALVNGSLIGYNAFALRNKFSFERPCQTFFVINKRLNAKIVTRPIFV